MVDFNKIIHEMNKHWKNDFQITPCGLEECFNLKMKIKQDNIKIFGGKESWVGMNVAFPNNSNEMDVVKKSLKCINDHIKKNDIIEIDKNDNRKFFKYRKLN